MVPFHFPRSRPKLGCARPVAVAPILLAALLSVLLLSSSGVYSAEVTLEWDPSTGSGIAGYKVHYGNSTRDYPHTVDVGNATTDTLSGLENNLAYYFAVTAYDTSGNGSDFSDELVYNGPISASGVGSDLVLTWLSVAAATRYIVYRNRANLYFTPTSADRVAVVTSPTYTDTGVLDRPNTSNYYVVKPVGALGQTVGVLRRAGEFDVSLSAGYNLIAHVLNEACTTGQDLGESIPNCTSVLRREAATGEWVPVAQKVEGTWVNHEAITPGRAYMAFVEASGTWTQIGAVPPDPHFELAPGYNMVTLPLQYAQDQGIVTGQDLGERIPDCTNVLRMDASTGKWVAVAEKVRGVWINRENVTAGRAYVACTSGSSVWP